MVFRWSHRQCNEIIPGLLLNVGTVSWFGAIKNLKINVPLSWDLMEVG